MNRPMAELLPCITKAFKLNSAQSWGMASQNEAEKYVSHKPFSNCIMAIILLTSKAFNTDPVQMHLYAFPSITG